jgi:hypothetical protein
MAKTTKILKKCIASVKLLVSLLSKDFCHFFHQPLCAEVYFPPFLASLKRPLFPRCTFWGYEFHQPPGPGPMTFFGLKNNLEVYFGQILQLAVNIKRLQGNHFSMEYKY